MATPVRGRTNRVSYALIFHDPFVAGLTREMPDFWAQVLLRLVGALPRRSTPPRTPGIPARVPRRGSPHLKWQPVRRTICGLRQPAGLALAFSRPGNAPRDRNRKFPCPDRPVWRRLDVPPIEAVQHASAPVSRLPTSLSANGLTGSLDTRCVTMYRIEVPRNSMRKPTYRVVWPNLWLSVGQFGARLPLPLSSSALFANLLVVLLSRRAEARHSNERGRPRPAAWTELTQLSDWTLKDIGIIRLPPTLDSVKPFWMV